MLNCLAAIGVAEIIVGPQKGEGFGFQTMEGEGRHGWVFHGHTGFAVHVQEEGVRSSDFEGAKPKEDQGVV